MSSEPDDWTADPAPEFPGGTTNPAYSLAVTLWLILFLGVLCLGMLNFLGIYLKRLV